jgi:hypothetical protein
MDTSDSMTRRHVLAAAGATAAITALAGPADAGDQKVVTLSAAQVAIDFGADGQLALKPDGILPTRGQGDRPPGR